MRIDCSVKGFVPLKRGETGRILLRYSRCTGGLVMFCCINFLHWMKTVGQGYRGHSCKLVKTRCTRDITKYFFSNKIINRWNLLDQRTLDASSIINAFKSRLVCIRDNRMGFFMDYSPLSPRTYWLDDLPVRLHKVYIITQRTNTTTFLNNVLTRNKLPRGSDTQLA